MVNCFDHSHDHEHEDEEGVSLHEYIDVDGVFCLNEHRAHAGQSVLKPYAERLSLVPNLRSPRDDDDPELLLHVPFTEAVGIKWISISGRAGVHVPDGDGTGATSAPCTCKVFADRTDLDFDTARELDGDATIELIAPEHLAEAEPDRGDDPGGGTLDYPLRPAGKFAMASSVTLFFGDNYAARRAEARGEAGVDVVPTEITYVGFKGVGTSIRRVAVEAVYETKGMRKDHRTPAAGFAAHASGAC
eukprot:CAMPEP_0194335248 /NCGR_PEP_ID=MMETSP0171-20130528/68892_1 /TAXON_ID=218684 /ORGANISM="Corethron pennatum, Strain L29A3" /LENGTH=245 /DNA_ID=CAMNT_0039098237 /DNA_START=149 /DNA_END=886 /DNA_ORIENTATION=-